MSENEAQFDAHFLQLVLSLQAGAMQHMGKTVSPVTGKIERDLELARHTIDILGMIQVKTKGNLSADESKLIEHVLYELRMNFVDESKKEKTGKTEPEKENTGSESGEGPGKPDEEKDSEK